jgi:hypothetical protein
MSPDGVVAHCRSHHWSVVLSYLKGPECVKSHKHSVEVASGIDLLVASSATCCSPSAMDSEIPSLLSDVSRVCSQAEAEGGRGSADGAQSHSGVLRRCRQSKPHQHFMALIGPQPGSLSHMEQEV